MKHLYIIVVAVLCAFNLNAQEIKGKILDENKQPLENAYIFNSRASSHAHSSETGMFLIERNKIGDTLEVGLLGFKKQYYIVKQSDFKNPIEIALKSKLISLEELVLTNQINVLNKVAEIDLQTSPVNSSQEILRKVPGLIIGQHAGGGKAEQIFLRGFDIDHGTDINLSVDGIPINMVSHAHGQGYSDLHFIIPETIDNINFGKGPYDANKGDFSTAGYVGFKTKDNIGDSEIKLEYGQFNSFRTLALLDLLGKNSSQNAYIGVEHIETDGPFESSQDFNRLNLVGKYSTYLKGNDKLSASATHFTSRWDASGQIPVREVENGNISRFGAIDDTEGGNTSRSNLNVNYFSYLNDHTRLKSNVYYSHYDFELYSNFTFFLEDPVNGDQIRQKENRNVFGFNLAIEKDKQIGNFAAEITSGIGLRRDNVDDIELSRTKNRVETLEILQLGDVDQTNAYAFVNADLEIGKFKVVPSLRLDYFKFLYNNELADTYETLSNSKMALSPKLSTLYDHSKNLQLFFKTGIGFHSNDARVVIENTEDILPKAYGVDLGSVWKPTSRMVFNTALWYLFLEQEFVYVGDAGIVEPSGKTERYGLDLGIRYEVSDWLSINTDATITEARSTESPEGEDYIPLAPSFTLAGGLYVTDLGKFSGGLQYRFLDDRPANEDYSITAEGYFVTDLNINYQVSDDLGLGIKIENLFDVDWNETQFATESRLQNEDASVEEIHFTPGTPFFAKATLRYNF